MISVYIHIPFCKDICSYCDFCKIYKIDKYVDSYLNALEGEIKKNYQGEKVKTLYIGGGTPSCLSLEQLQKLFQIIQVFDLNNDIEFTIECNVCDITEKFLNLCSANKVNRLSIGVQTFEHNLISYLNRKHTKEEAIEKIKLAKTKFENINLDLIYAIKNQTIIDLKNDISQIIELDIPHISTYSLMIEPHTILKDDEPIDEEIDYKMYQTINDLLIKSGYNHYEISNYSKKGYESKHNLIYWNNEHYYGFGLSASGYIKNQRYANTKNLNQYLKGNYKKEIENLSIKEQMQEEMFLGLRKMDGVDEQIFYEKYHQTIEDSFNIQKLLKENKLIKENGHIKIPDSYLYISNEILINFVDGE